METKKKTYDLDALLAQSQSLNTHRDGSKRMRRGVSELADASRQLESSESRRKGAYDAGSDQKAFRLLSQQAFDAESLMNEVNTMEIKAQFDPVEPLEGTDIEGYLAHHHDMIIIKAIDDARRVADEDVADIQKRWATEEWVSSRRNMMESLGHRSHMWKKMGLTASHRDQTPATHGRHSMTPSGRDAHETSSLYLHSRALTDRSQTPAAAPAHSDSSSKQYQTALLKDHAAVVRVLHQSDQQGHSPGGGALVLSETGEGSRATAALQPATVLANQLDPFSGGVSASTAAAHGMNELDVIAYRNLLELVAAMTGEGGDRARPAGFFSPVAVDHPDLSQEVIGECRSVLSTGARGFLERKFEEMVCAEVDARLPSSSAKTPDSAARWSSGHGQGATKSRRERMRDFTKLQSLPSVCFNVKVNSSVYGMEADRGVEVPVWPQVYFCLRAGALQEARAILKFCIDENISGVDVDAFSALDGLLKISEWGQDRASGHLRAVLASLSRCAGLYKEAAAPQSGRALGEGDFEGDDMDMSLAYKDPSDPYRTQVLNLLGLADLDAICTGMHLADTTIEDFLWASLWFVHWSKLLASCANCAEALGEVGGEHLPVPPSLHKSASHTMGKLSGGAHSPAAFHSMLDAPQSSPGFQKQMSSMPTFGRQHMDQTGPTTPVRRDVLNTIRRRKYEHLPREYSEGDIWMRAKDAGGAEYFDPSKTAPFTYATILCCCHRFGDAIVHLWQANRSFPAVHILVLAMHYGLVLPHQPLLSPREGWFRQESGHDDATGSDLYPSSILSVWISSSRIAPLDICQKADYLVALNSSWLKHVKGLGKDLTEVSRFKTNEEMMRSLAELLCTLNPHDMSLLVGDESESTGTRLSGHLDIYLGREMVDTLLARTAHTLLSVKRDIAMGIKLYELVGMYVEVLEELCNQLSLTMILPAATAGGLLSLPGGGAQQKATRKYWKDRCEEFYNRLLNTSSNGTGGIVTERLQQAGRLGLRDTFKVLLNLSLFVDKCYDERYKEALEYLDELGVLPSPGCDSGQAMSAMAHRFSQFETPVKRVMDDIMVLCMECIGNIYQQAKREGDSRLQAMSSRASALVTFAGYVQRGLFRPTDTMNKLSALEVKIM